MIEFGIISTIDFASGTAKVELETDNIVTGNLPIMQRNNGYFAALATGTPVAVLLDENAENGVVLGAIYDGDNAPPDEANESSDIVKFKDGTIIKYDTEAGMYSITVGETVYNNSASGHVIKKSGTSLKTTLNDLISAIKSLTVICAAQGSPSSTPVNVVDFEAIDVKINTLFSE